MLSKKDGFEVCKYIRKTSNVSIIMITAKGEDYDRKMGLDIGADDYIVKPFSPGEVTARIRAILRRVVNINENSSSVFKLLISTLLSISFTKLLTKMKAVAIKLSNEEYNVKTYVEQNDEIGELAYTIDMLCEKLYISSKESENLEKMRRDFISNISHELRTPVTVIRGSLEALCDGILNEPKKISEYHNQMLSESIRLQRLVNDLLDLSKLQNSDFKLKMTPLNLIDILNSSIRSMKPIANKKGINIILNNTTKYIW